MTTIPATLVKQLRDLTGAPMMDCKRALEQSGGDLEAARRILREQEAAAAATRDEALEQRPRPRVPGSSGPTRRFLRRSFGYFGLPRRFLRLSATILRALLPHK